MNNHKPFIISIIFLVILMAAPSISAASSTTVYVTDTGSKYHVSNCSYLRSSKHAIDLEDAVELGYTPCSRCKPPTYSASILNNETPSTRSNEISVEDDKIVIDKSSLIWFASGCGATIIIRKIIKIFQGD